MLKTLRNLCLGIIAVMTLPAQNPSIGTWKLNVAKSKFTNLPAPRSEMITYSLDGDWSVSKSERITADGKTTTQSNRYKVDGKEYPFTAPNGTSGTITVKKIDEYHYDWATKGEGNSFVNGHTVISKNGKMRTHTAEGVTAKGEKVKLAFVYDRQ